MVWHYGKTPAAKTILKWHFLGKFLCHSCYTLSTTTLVTHFTDFILDLSFVPATIVCECKGTTFITGFEFVCHDFSPVVSEVTCFISGFYRWPFNHRYINWESLRIASVQNVCRTISYFVCQLICICLEVCARLVTVSASLYLPCPIIVQI